MSNNLPPYTAPSINRDAYNCPYCDVFAHQISFDSFITNDDVDGYIELPWLKTVQCKRCKQYQLWRGESLIFPESLVIAPPNEDLNEDIKRDYNEARSIVQKSLRGATALLRLCIQKLCIQLGEPNKNLNIAISNLVEKGLPVKIQQALDIVRVIGNEAVHPGQMDIKDDIDIATQLFHLVNLISETMISQPKKIDDLYKKLPQTKKDAIKDRDKKKESS